MADKNDLLSGIMDRAQRSISAELGKKPHVTNEYSLVAFKDKLIELAQRDVAALAPGGVKAAAQADLDQMKAAVDAHIANPKSKYTGPFANKMAAIEESYANAQEQYEKNRASRRGLFQPAPRSESPEATQAPDSNRSGKFQRAPRPGGQPDMLTPDMQKGDLLNNLGPTLREGPSLNYRSPEDGNIPLKKNLIRREGPDGTIKGPLNREYKDLQGNPSDKPVTHYENVDNSVLPAGGEKARPQAPALLPSNEAATPLFDPDAALSIKLLHDSIKTAATKAHAALHDGNIYEDVSKGQPVYRKGIIEYRYVKATDAYLPDALTTSELLKSEILADAQKTLERQGGDAAAAAITKLQKMDKLTIEELAKDPLVGKLFSDIDKDHTLMVKEYNDEQRRTPKPKVHFGGIVPVPPDGRNDELEFSPEPPAPKEVPQNNGPVTSLPKKGATLVTQNNDGVYVPLDEEGRKAQEQLLKAQERRRKAQERLDIATQAAVDTVIAEIKDGAIRTGTTNGITSLIMGTQVYLPGEEPNKFEMQGSAQFMRFDRKLNNAAIAELDKGVDEATRDLRNAISTAAKAEATAALDAAIDAHNLLSQDPDKALKFEREILQRTYDNASGKPPAVLPEKLLEEKLRVPLIEGKGLLAPPRQKREYPGGAPTTDTENLADKRVKPAGKETDDRAQNYVELMPHEEFAVPKGLPTQQGGARKLPSQQGRE